MLNDRGPFPRQRDLPLRHRRQQPQQIGAIQSEDYAGRRGGARQVDRANARMRFRREDERAEVLLERRSAYVLAGAARWEWEHQVPPVKELRYSITFRTLRA